MVEADISAILADLSDFEPDEMSDDSNEMMELLGSGKSGAGAGGKRWSEHVGESVREGRDRIVAPFKGKLSELKHRLSELEEDADDFDEGKTEMFDERDVVVVGSISLEEAEEQERRLEAERLAVERREQGKVRMLEQTVLRRQREALKHIELESQRREKIAKERVHKRTVEHRMRMEGMQKAFRKAEDQLRCVLEGRKGEVTSRHGVLEEAPHDYSGMKSRRWRVDWTHTPQAVQIRLHMMRAVKDRLPKGRYVMTVSMMNTLGGDVMRWSKLKGQAWCGATLPLDHGGEFFDIELPVEQSVFTVCPAGVDLRPSMIFVFELFQLANDIIPIDHVVGWGAFPLSDCNFDVIRGTFRCPMIRGVMDLHVETFRDIERLISSDLNNWMSNLYFEVKHLPRYAAGQKEYEVELQFTSALLGHPERDGGVRRRKKQQMADRQRMTLQRSRALLTPQRTVGGFGESPRATMSRRTLGTDLRVAESPIMSTRSFMSDGGDDGTVRSTVREKERIEDEFLPLEEDELPAHHLPSLRNPQGMRYYEHGVETVSFVPLAEVHRRRQARFGGGRTKQHTASRQELGDFKYSVVEERRGQRHHRESATKLQFLQREWIPEMGLSSWKSSEFWITIFVLICVFYLRLFVHYFGEYLFLRAVGVPISEFEVYPYTVGLAYSSRVVPMWVEIGVTAVGQFFVWLCFLFLIGVVVASQSILGVFPRMGSRMVMSWGVSTVVDPLLVFLVDLASGNWQGDAFKLYNKFVYQEGNGFAGVVVTLFAYLFVTILTLFAFYNYFISVHNGSRMMDIFHRLQDDECEFFLPDDMEISTAELHYICEKAERWRGASGERRKVAVTDYMLTEPEDRSFVGGKTTHLCVYQLDLDGTRTLYRHFLRMSDGSIHEVFLDVDTLGIEAYNALQDAAVLHGHEGGVSAIRAFLDGGREIE